AGRCAGLAVRRCAAGLPVAVCSLAAGGTGGVTTCACRQSYPQKPSTIWPILAGRAGHCAALRHGYYQLVPAVAGRVVVHKRGPKAVLAIELMLYLNHMGGLRNTGRFVRAWRKANAPAHTPA